MSEPQSSSGSASEAEKRRLTPDILTSDSDEKFFQSLRDFIEHEKRYQQCPEEGPDELRYIIYRSAFNKVIGRATAYKRLLLTIKAAYDDVIKALQSREGKVRTAPRAAAASHRRSLMTCQRRAAHLRDRICVLQRETAELQEEMKRQKLSEEQSTWIPGLTVSQSEDPEVLDEHLKRLEAQRAALQDRKSLCVSVEVKAELDAELQDAERRRDRLSGENDSLSVLYRRLSFMSCRLSSWEDQKLPLPLEELLGSTLENVRQAGVMDDDGSSNIDGELFEHDEPTGVDESKAEAECLDRFMELLDSAQFEDAALLAARSPRGVLRNLHIMEMFKGVTGPPGCPAPLLLFLQALLMTSSPGDALPAALSVQLVVGALQHGALRLITHAINNNKLTFSEDLGDALTEHAQKSPAAADTCLALATVVYEARRLNGKTALSMCRRGLIHGAAHFMTHCHDLTAEDCMRVLCLSPSLSLLQLLTAPQPGRAAVLSVGVACCALLAEPQQQQLAVRLLDSFVSRGALDEAVLQDGGSSVVIWTRVASLCSELSRPDLSRAVLSVLLDQSWTGALSPDLQGAELMEHVFL